MSVMVNGKQAPWREGMTVEELLETVGSDSTPVVVRVGSKTVSRKDFHSFVVPRDVEVFLIYMVAGG